MYRLYQNSNTWTKIRIAGVSVVLSALAAVLLSQIDWTQLNHAANLSQPRNEPTGTIAAAAEQNPEVILPAEKVVEETPVPASTPQPADMSCNGQKNTLKAQYEAALRAEDDKFNHAKDKIADAYSARGMAFSSAQKRAQAVEASRHSKALKDLQSNYQKQLKKLSC